MQDEESLGGLVRAEQGAPSAAIVEAEHALGVGLPRDYVDFMRASDGAEGPVGDEGYVVLWPIGELAEYNEDSEAAESYLGHILIGTIGAGEAVAIWQGERGPEYVLMPFIGGLEDALVGGATPRDFLRAYGRGDIWQR